MQVAWQYMTYEDLVNVGMEHYVAGVWLYPTPIADIYVWSDGSVLYILIVIVPQVIKNPPAMRETWVQSLGWKNPLEKGKATHSSILAFWNSSIPEFHGQYSLWGHKESDTTEPLLLTSL